MLAELKARSKQICHLRENEPYKGVFDSIDSGRWTFSLPVIPVTSVWLTVWIFSILLLVFPVVISDNNPCLPEYWCTSILNANPCTLYTSLTTSTGQLCSCSVSQQNFTVCLYELAECSNSTCQQWYDCIAWTNGSNSTCTCPEVVNATCYNVSTNNDTNVDNSSVSCQSEPCFNNATCVDSDSGYNCTCPLGYIGDRCQNMSCDVVTCNNGGNCSENGVSWWCSCPPQFDGDLCQSVRSCNSSSCSDHGNCSYNYNGARNCTCEVGYLGPSCEQVDWCVYEPCMNNGSCLLNASTGYYSCDCPPGIIGDNCSMVDACRQSYLCANGGTCVNLADSHGGYTCNCVANYTGSDCSILINPCFSHSCQNGATCVPRDGGFHCSCLTQFTGARCETQMSVRCNSSHCHNGGTCSQVGGVCDCLPGFTGSLCETAVSAPCSSSPCSNNGSCTDTDNGFTCHCHFGFTGHTCENAVLCPSNCSGRGSCADSVCQCDSQYTGLSCESLIPSGSGDSDVSSQLGLIVGLSVGIFVALVFVIGIIIFVKIARSKRASEGTYRPSQQEMAGQRVDLGNEIKPPPEERLI